MKPKSKRSTTLHPSHRKKILASAILAGLMTSVWPPFRKCSLGQEFKAKL
jgi:hypothetical protein